MFTLSGGQGAALAALHASCRTHLEEFVAQQGDGWSTLMGLEADLSIWLQALETHPENAQYRSAHRDFGLSFFAVSTGLYRQAFAGLRSFIEVSFGALHLSSHELERRKWVSGRRDLSWSAITSQDTGLYAAAYVREFRPEAVDESQPLLEGLVSAYRRCSEYLHGNVSTSDMLPQQIAYTVEPIEEWKSAARQALLALHHSLFVRYYDDLGERSRSQVEFVLEQRLGHLTSVRKVLQLPVEEI